MHRWIAATLAASWERDGKGAQLVLRRVGAQYEDDLNSRTLKGATTVDAYASWPLTRTLLLVARGENITNKLVMAGIGGNEVIMLGDRGQDWLSPIPQTMGIWSKTITAN